MIRDFGKVRGFLRIDLGYWVALVLFCSSVFVTSVPGLFVCEEDQKSFGYFLFAFCVTFKINPANLRTQKNRFFLDITF